MFADGGRSPNPSRHCPLTLPKIWCVKNNYCHQQQCHQQHCHTISWKIPEISSHLSSNSQKLCGFPIDFLVIPKEMWHYFWVVLEVTSHHHPWPSPCLLPVSCQLQDWTWHPYIMYLLNYLYPAFCNSRCLTVDLVKKNSFTMQNTECKCICFVWHSLRNPAELFLM